MIDGQNLNGSILHKVAEVLTGVLIFRCIRVHGTKRTGFGGYLNIASNQIRRIIVWFFCFRQLFVPIR